MDLMDIVLICDDGYIVPTMVTLFSIIQTKKATSKIRANIIVKTSDKLKYELIKKIEQDDFTINIIYSDEAQIDNLNVSPRETFCVATTSALLKFFIPDFCKDCEKVIYLDGDILVRKDLAELYKTDVSNAYGAAVIDSGKLYSKRQIVLDTENYFNSGVMVLNIPKMRTVVNELVKEKQHQQDKSLMDQDVFNNVIGKNMIMLPIKFNFLYTNLARRNDKNIIKNLNVLYNTNYLNLREIYYDSYVLHFSSKDKPWLTTDAPMARKWYECFQMMKEYLKDKGSTELIDKFERGLPNDVRIQNAIRNKKLFGIKKEIIVSLTTYPKRIDRVNKVIDCLFEQIEIVDKIVLCLIKEEWNNTEELPKWIEEYSIKGLEILWGSKNLKPHNKYFYTMQKYPEDIIITVDDDNVYDNKVTETLLQSYMKFPNCVSANRVHLISFDKNKQIKPYMQWNSQVIHNMLVPNLSLLPTGVGGVLYPPHCLYKEAFNDELIKRLCPTTDDLWLKIMSVKQGISTVCAASHSNLNLLEEMQDTALYKVNRGGGENDRQFKNIWNYFSAEEDMIWKQEIYCDFQKINAVTEKPIFSLIVPICEKECNFVACVNSLLKQNVRNNEIIILDNGSKGKRLLEFAGNSKVKIVIDNFFTRAQAANVGLRMAEGQYILVANPHVSYHADFLEKVYQKASYNDADIIYFKIDYWDTVLKKYKFSDWEKKFYGFPAYATFSFDDIPNDKFSVFSYRVCDKVFKKDYLVSQKVQFAEEGSCYGDLNFIFTLIVNAERIVVVNEPLGEQDVNEILVHSIYNKWSFIRNSMLTFRKKLEVDFLKWDKCYQDYINFELFACMNEYKYVRADEIEEHYNQLKKDFKELDIIEDDEKFFYNDKLYRMRNHIRDFDFLWAMWKICNSVDTVDTTRVQIIERDNGNLRKENERMKERISELEYYQYSINEIRKSFSYKIGLFMTIIPRSLRRIKRFFKA